MKLKDKLTIVIPCKNELNIIVETLSLLDNQIGIDNVSVIVSDSSTDNTRDLIQSRTYKFNLQIINGGFPSVARNSGALLAETPYILFLDADVFLYDPNILTNCINQIDQEDYDLLTCKFRVKGRYFYIFPIFEYFRKTFFNKTVFCVGGFMLFNKSVFFELGGFDTNHIFAEDYTLSSKINKNKFLVTKNKVYTTDRRFQKKGVFYMLKMMVLSYLNKNNSSFFEKDHNYWV